MSMRIITGPLVILAFATLFALLVSDVPGPVIIVGFFGFLMSLWAHEHAPYV